MIRRRATAAATWAAAREARNAKSTARGHDGEAAAVLKIDFQTAHDAMQRLVMATRRLHGILLGDFPEVAELIRADVEEASEATEAVAAIVRQMERLP